MELATEASVLLELVVAKDGTVSEAKIVEGGDAALNALALKRARNLLFTPATRDQEPIAARIRFRMIFTPRVTAPQNHAVAGDARAPSTPRVHATESTAHQAPSAAPAPPKAGPEASEYGGEVTVQAAPRGATLRTIAGDDMRRMPGTRGDAFRAIESLPGVSRPPAGEGEPILRGTSGNESSVQLDGATIPLLYHFGGLTSVVHARLLERVDVYPSNFSVRYGRVFGGVVDAKTRNPRRDGFHAVLDVSLLDSSALIETPVSETSSVAVAARRSNLDVYFGALVPDDAYAVIAAPVYWDYQGLFVHALSSRHELRVLGYGSRDRIELLLNDPVESDPTLRGNVGGALEFHRLSLQTRSAFDGGVRQDASLTLGHVQLGQAVGDSVDADLSVLSVDARGEWQLPLFSSASMTFGFDVATSFSKGSYRGSRPPQLEGDPRINEAEANQSQVQLADRFSNLSPGAYVELSLTPAARVLLTPGLRVDYFHTLQHTTLDPRLTARLRLLEQTTLKGGVGLFTQEPLYFETLAGIGNPNLKPARALHQTVGMEQGFGRTATLGLDLFARRLFDRVVATKSGAAPYFENDGDGRVLGLELYGRLRAGRTAGSFAYTLSRSERRDHDRQWRLFDEDQTHNLVTSVRQDLGTGWLVGARFRLTSGSPHTPVQGSVYDASTGLYRPLYGDVNSARDAAFHQLDLLVEKTWRFSEGKLAAYLDLQNAYNRQNPEGVSYSYDYSKSEVATGLPIFPNLGVRGEL